MVSVSLVEGNREWEGVCTLGADAGGDAEGLCTRRGTGGGFGTVRCSRVASCWIASRVEVPIARHGAAGVEEFRIERRSWAVLRSRVSVVIFGKGTVSGKYCTVSAILVAFVAGT